MTAIDRRSKPDTILFGADDAAGIGVDASQRRLNLTAHVGYYDETTSARTAIEYGREITIRATIASADTGTLVEHGNAKYRIQLLANGVLRFQENGLAVVSAIAPGIVAAGRVVVIQWCKRPLAGSAWSEVTIYNETTATYVHASASHASTAPSGGDTFAVGARVGGSGVFTGTLKAYRIGRRFHSQAEMKEDWIAQSSPAAVAATRRGAYLSPDKATADIFSEGNFAGPPHLWAGHAFREASMRLVSPLVNMRTATPAALTYTYDTGSSAWYRSPPGQPAYHISIAHLFCSPVPLGVNMARVRIFLRQVAIGTTCSTYWRMYSIRDLATMDDAPKPAEWSSSVPVSSAVNHGAGVGSWIDLGNLRLKVDDLGYTWLALAHSFGLDTGSTGESSTTCRVKAITVEPFYQAPSPDGFDLEPQYG